MRFIFVEGGVVQGHPDDCFLIDFDNIKEGNIPNYPDEVWDALKAEDPDAFDRIEDYRQRTIEQGGPSEP